MPIQLELAIKSKTSENLSTLVKILGKNSNLTKTFTNMSLTWQYQLLKWFSLPHVGRTHSISKEPIKPKTVPKTWKKSREVLQYGPTYIWCLNWYIGRKIQLKFSKFWHRKTSINLDLVFNYKLAVLCSLSKINSWISCVWYFCNCNCTDPNL